MEGGKDDEKNMRPMFPRLHVSDTEKGGPRAPPRNKMALYEQLSVPSQRFNSGTASSLPAARNNAAPLVPVASLSKEGGHERTAFPPFQIPPTPADSNDTIHSHHSDVLNARSKTQRSEPKRTKLAKYKTSNASVHLSSTAECGVFPLSHLKNVSPGAGNDNDFSVPTFVNAGTTSNKDHHNVDKERLTPLSPIHPSRSTETSGNSIQKAASATCNSSAHLHGARDKHLKRTNTTDLWSRQHVRHQNEENLLESVTSKGHAERTASHPYSRETIAEPSKHTYATPSQEHGSTPFDDMEGLHDNETNGHLEQKHKAGFLAKSVPHSDGMLVESIAPTGKGNVLQGRSESCSRASLGNNRGSCNEYCEDQIHGGATDVDRNDDASETSMVDSISGFDISPDDVVGVIGQKHFWKARRAIVNQQRLFSVQVFELHRLIKVQKLIAGSPHLLLEDTAYLTKPPLKTPPAKKLSVEYLLKSPPQTVKQQAESQKPSQSTECAAENVVAKPPPQPSVSGGVNREHVNQQSNHEQQHVNQTPAPVTGGNKTGWSFHPPPGNQWLVPVMSASEGLVYKPYTGSCPPSAGFMAPIYGGCGPLRVPSMGGEYPSPYGIPSPHHQGMGLHSNAPPFAQPYFSPYGMQMMNPVISASSFEHGNPFAGGQSRERKEQVSTGEVNFNVHSRTSRNISNQKSEAISSKFPKFQTFKESDIQGSTASSPGEKAHKERASNVSEGRNALSLFPMASPAQGPDELADIQKSDQQRARVIKVVPHNPRSATESAARIFQSIQEERQQYD